jgi:hypothetical protein
MSLENREQLVGDSAYGIIPASNLSLQKVAMEKDQDQCPERKSQTDIPEVRCENKAIAKCRDRSQGGRNHYVSLKPSGQRMRRRTLQLSCTKVGQPPAYELTLLLKLPMPTVGTSLLGLKCRYQSFGRRRLGSYHPVPILDRYGCRKSQTFTTNATVASPPQTQAIDRSVGCPVPLKRIAIAQAAKVRKPTVGRSFPNHAPNAKLIPATNETCVGETQRII